MNIKISEKKMLRKTKYIQPIRGSAPTVGRHGVERHGVERHGVERHGVERHGVSALCILS